MRKIFVFVSIVLLTGCASSRMNTKSQLRSYTPIPVTTKRLDIPKYEAEHPFNGYPYAYWHFCKQKEKQLGLENPEVSNSSLIFRIWITDPVGTKGQPHVLLEIKNDSNVWRACLYAMLVDFNLNKLSEKIVKFEKIEIAPLYDDWDYLFDRLYELKFDVLPTDNAIPNYYADSLGYDNNLPAFSFEYATKYKYRFYQYKDIKRKADDFWQAENVLEIFDLLNDELDLNDLIDDLFDSLEQDEGAIDHDCKGIDYALRVDAGAFVPLNSLKKNLGVNPHIGLFIGLPYNEKYRIDMGLSVFMPVNRKELAYYLPNETLTGKADLSGAIGLWLSRTDCLRNCWVIDNRFGTGLGILGTNIKKDKPKDEDDEWYSAETIFFSLGTGIRKGNLGLGFNYFFVPYNAFRKNLKSDFGSQYLTISAYYTF